MQTVNSTPVVGLPKFDGWSQVFSDSQHSFICTFSISGANAGNVGRDVVDYLNLQAPSNAQSLYEIVHYILKEVEDKKCELCISAGIFSEGRCYLAAYQGTVCLKRGSKVGVLLSADKSIRVIEGKSSVADIFVLFTDQARSFLGEIQQKLNQGFDVDTIITSVVPGLHATEQSAISAIAFCVIEEKSADELDTVPLVQETAPDFSAVSLVEVTVPSPVLPVAMNAKKTRMLPTVKFPKLKLPTIKPIISWFQEKLHPQEVYIDQWHKKRKLKTVIPLFILGIVLVGVALLRHRQVVNQTKAAEAILDPIQQQFVQAQSLAATDPIAAREQVKQVNTELEQAQQHFTKQKTTHRLLSDKLSEVQQYFDSISGQEEFSQLPTFYDLRLAKSDFIASAVVYQKPYAYFLDTGLNQIVRLQVDTKEATVFSAESMTGAMDIAVHGQYISVLANGLWQLTDQGTQPQQVRAEEDENKDATLIASFGDSLYVLNPERRAIYRYQPKDANYDTPTSWLKSQGSDSSSGNSLNLAQAHSLTIDGDIWVTGTQGQVWQLRSGRPLDFSLKGLPESLSGSLVIFTSENTEKLYLLEAAKHRLLVLTKDGDFLKEIKSGSIASGTDLFVDENLNKAFVVSGSVLFEVAL